MVSCNNRSHPTRVRNKPRELWDYTNIIIAWLDKSEDVWV